MSKGLFDGPEVHLGQVLSAREARSQRQAQLLERYAPAVLVSMTLNTPGPVKNSEGLSKIGHQLAQLVSDHLAQEAVLYQDVLEAVTGLEAYWVVSQEAELVKRHLVAFEGQHPLGRLLDLDVLELVEGIPCPISRRQLGLAPRQCFLCQADAKQCARSRQHSVADMQAYISQAVANYEAQTESP